MSINDVGVVRRMDELGRVVIPKEVRKSFHIGKNEPLEIFVDGNNTIVLRKYHTQPNMEALAQEYAETLYKTFNQAVLVDDSHSIIAVAGLPKREYLNKPIPDELLLEGLFGLVDLTPSEGLPFAQAAIEAAPLPAENKGRFIMLAKSRGEMGAAESKSIQAATQFLAKWAEKKSGK
ncbi:MAG: stage V sporulation T C-terminal domain-containing protein [Negativicutes bacterium]|nr:stage V sporulation T C-terminal domain-containing protein [Negativicutes bacterium]